MKDTVISAVAAAAFLLLFVNGLRIILQKSVIRAVQKVQAFSIPKLQLTLPSKSDIGAYVEGLIGTASSRPLDTLVLAVISSMPLMVRYADRWPWRLRLVCAVAVSLAYACFTEVLLRLWFFSCLEGIGAVPSDVFEGTPKDMLVRAIVIGGNPPLQHGSHQFHLIYDIIRSIQFAVATIFLSVPGNQLSGRDGQ